ncbi:hypothetical protein RFI_26431 [Reticulomyxa filosa]|uniref:Uncharacterized protein n=1 Tax=Reticulomyxa filosa TaxID=46433 RepID=X6MAS8_RETFI|nr:hypothetical protein RFI_26431 [Reticulomyxa filosa]|eukprot:ETO10949.1 hypothetical protein RFI_26431 [Reticulomyxa filosa]
MLNIIGFQSQDIQNYVCYYFKNINANNESDVLIKKLNNNPSLYLRLFCYLSRQNKSSSSNNDKWDEMALSKLYETLLKNKIFNKFEMEMNYLSQISWKGLKCEQAIIPCEIQ